MPASEPETAEGDTGPRRNSIITLVVLLGGVTALLGARHNPARPDSSTVISATPVMLNLLAGHGTARATGWAPTRSFRLVPGSAWGALAGLDSAEQVTLLKLNRMDLRHARRRSLVVPDSIGQEIDYAPFPSSIPSLATTPKFIAVSRRLQAFAAYQYGWLIRWGPTSTGKAATPTETGLFFTNWKKRRTVSTDDPSWILHWYVNIDATKGVAFHQYELPGQPASHGCVRLLEADARWIYRWAAQWVPGRGREVKRYGTPVLIFGDYDPAAPPPAAESSVTREELEGALEAHLGTVVERSE
jgi:hypothetical protein